MFYSIQLLQTIEQNHITGNIKIIGPYGGGRKRICILVDGLSEIPEICSVGIQVRQHPQRTLEHGCLVGFDRLDLLLDVKIVFQSIIYTIFQCPDFL